MQQPFWLRSVLKFGIFEAPSLTIMAAYGPRVQANAKKLLQHCSWDPYGGNQGVLCAQMRLCGVCNSHFGSELRSRLAFLRPLHSQLWQFTAQKDQPQLNNHCNIPHRIHVEEAKGYISHGWGSLVFASAILAQICAQDSNF